MRLLPTAKTVRQELNNFYSEVKRKLPVQINNEEHKILHEIEKYGMHN